MASWHIEDEAIVEETLGQHPYFDPTLQVRGHLHRQRVDARVMLCEDDVMRTSIATEQSALERLRIVKTMVQIKGCAQVMFIYLPKLGAIDAYYYICHVINCLYFPKREVTNIIKHNNCKLSLYSVREVC
jgi:hypothetical protein